MTGTVPARPSDRFVNPNAPLTRAAGRRPREPAHVRCSRTAVRERARADPRCATRFRSGARRTRGPWPERLGDGAAPSRPRCGFEPQARPARACCPDATAALAARAVRRRARRRGARPAAAGQARHGAAAGHLPLRRRGPSGPTLAALSLAALGLSLHPLQGRAARGAAPRARRDGVDAARLERIAAAIALGRDLVNTPANDLGPARWRRRRSTLARPSRRRRAPAIARRGAAGRELAADPCRRPRRRRGRRASSTSTWGDADAPEGHAGRQGRLLRHRRPRHQAASAAWC